MSKIMKIESGVPVPGRPKHNFDFGSMKAGDSRKIHDISPRVVMQSYANWLAKGTYSIRKETEGCYRFHLLKKLK